MSNIFKFGTQINNYYIKYKIPSLNSEIYLIKWLPNIKSDFHGHNGKDCNFILLWGSYLFEERCKNKLSVISCQKIKPFKKYHINDKIGIHRLINTENKIKWSIHRYI